jgi:hypothetical protein
MDFIRAPFSTDRHEGAKPGGQCLHRFDWDSNESGDLHRNHLREGLRHFACTYTFSKGGAVMLKGTRILKWGAWLGLWLLAVPVIPVRAVQHGPDYPSVTEVGADLPNRPAVPSVRPTGIPPLLTNSTAKKSWEYLQTIRIGRLELRRKYYEELYTTTPAPYDPNEMLRFARHLAKPAVSITYDLHWRDR